MSDGDNSEQTDSSEKSNGPDVMSDVLAKMVAEHGPEDEDGSLLDPEVLLAIQVQSPKNLLPNFIGVVY